MAGREDLAKRAAAQIERVCRRCAGAREITIREIAERARGALPERTVGAIEQVARGLGIRHMRFASGAIHDADLIANLAPTGMIFVPCEEGSSHSPAENAGPEDLAAGARVPAATPVELASG